MSTVAAPQNPAHRYAPLAAMALALGLAFAGLPSALNLPQTNPSESLEYAPVPPNSNNAAPPGGNFAGLGEGTTGTVPGGGAGSGDNGSPPPLPGLPGGQGSNLPGKNCVGGHQTEDPLSPPCVASFSGNNGGSTYHGVSGTTINVVYYVDCSSKTMFQTSQGTESPTCGEVDDASAPSAASKFVTTRVLHAYSAYFNARYQTYNRQVHIWAVYSHDPDPPQGAANAGGSFCGASCKLADASQDYSQLNPFTVSTESGQEGNAPMDGYVQAMAKNRVVAFDNDQQPSSFYQQYPGQVWGYLPSVDDEAAIYAGYLCTKLFHQQADYGGGSVAGAAAGTPRDGHVALLYYQGGTNAEGGTAPDVPFYDDMRRLLESDLSTGCGAKFVDEKSETAVGALNGGDEPTVKQIMATWKSQGVTTVVWDAQEAGNVSQDATNVGFFPEWMVLGDGAMEDFIVGRYSDQTNWPQSFVVSVSPFQTTEPAKPCSQAILSVDSNWPSGDLPEACNVYDTLRQLFTGIQVAGPNLTPASMDEGFHAIPAHRSSSPAVPACFYPAGNYTCVKDAEVMWWNPSGQVPGWTGNGCYAAVQGGQRYFGNTWPAGNVDAQRNKNSDPCNGYGGSAAGGPWTQT